jgi:hypothetical protein
MGQDNTSVTGLTDFTRIHLYFPLSGYSSYWTIGSLLCHRLFTSYWILLFTINVTRRLTTTIACAVAFMRSNAPLLPQLSPAPQQSIANNSNAPR